MLQIPKLPFWIYIYLFSNNGFVSTKIYDKLDDSNCFLLDGYVPRRPSYVVYISQLLGLLECVVM